MSEFHRYASVIYGRPRLQNVGVVFIVIASIIVICAVAELAVQR